MMTDSHTHLTEPQLYEEVDQVLNRFIQKGGKALLNVGHDPESNLQTIKLAKKFGKDPRLSFKSTIGLHPQLFYTNSHYTQKILSNDALSKCLREYETLLSENIELMSAIGETGLDYFRLFEDNDLKLTEKENSKELQMLSFRRHTELAAQHNLPLTIHTRDPHNSSQCTEDVIKILCEVVRGKVRGSFHSFTGSREIHNTVLDLGFYIGFNGIITYRTADNVREILKVTPLDRILLETDAPYLPPQAIRSNPKLPVQHGQPSDIYEIAKVAAEVKGVSVEKIIEESSHNFFILFGE